MSKTHTRHVRNMIWCHKLSSKNIHVWGNQGRSVVGTVGNLVWSLKRVTSDRSYDWLHAQSSKIWNQFPARHPWGKNTTFPQRGKNGDGHRNEEEENLLAANKINDAQHFFFMEKTNCGRCATCGRRKCKMASTVLWTSGQSIFLIQMRLWGSVLMMPMCYRS